MKIIRDGHLSSMITSLLYFIGANIMFYAFDIFPDNSIEQIIGVSIGMAIGGIGGYSAQAHTMHRKPFNNLTFPKNKPGEKTPPESLFEKVLDWTFLISAIASGYYWVMLNK